MLPATDDSQTLSRSVKDPELFSEFYRRHTAAILRYLRGRLSADVAEDAAHEVFLRAFRQRGSYEPRFDTARPWLYGIAANVISDLRRHEARQLKTLERKLAEEPVTDVADEAPAGLSPEVVAALKQLSLIDRETLLLSVWGELSYEETAVALGVPVGTIRSRLSRARTLLRAQLAPTADRPGPNGEVHA